MEYARQLLEEIGLGAHRLEMQEIAASDAPKWVAAVTDLTRKVQALGPNPLRRGREHPGPGAELEDELEAMVKR